MQILLIKRYFLRPPVVEEPPLLREGDEPVPEPREGELSVRGVERGVSCEGTSVRGRWLGSVRGAGLRSCEGVFVRGVVLRSLRGLTGFVRVRSRAGADSRGLLSPGLAVVLSVRGFDGV